MMVQYESIEETRFVRAIKRALRSSARSANRTQSSLVAAMWRSRLKDLGEGSEIRRTVKIYAPSHVEIGSRSVLNDYVHIWGAGDVSIGDNTLLATHVVVTSQSHDINALKRGLLYRDTTVNAPVSIGSNVWIGSGACILSGVTIGGGAVVGAGAVVTRDVPAGCLVMGVPARLARFL